MPLFPAPRLWPSLAPSALSLQAPFGQIGPNGGPPFGQTEPNEARSTKQDRTEALRSVLFGQTVPKGRGRWRPERAGAGEPRRGIKREHVLRSWEEMGERRTVPGRRKEETERRCAQRKGAVPERRRRGDGSLFGPVWPNSAERKRALGAGEGRCRRAKKGHRERAYAEELGGDGRKEDGARKEEGGDREEMCPEEGSDAGEKMERRRARGKGAVPERNRREDGLGGALMETGRDEGSAGKGAVPERSRREDGLGGALMETERDEGGAGRRGMRREGEGVCVERKG